MLATRDRARAKLVRSVSSASFHVRGEHAFERAITVSAGWIRDRNAKVPAEAEGGAPFDVGGGGEHDAQAIRQQFGTTTIWAATMDDPDAVHLGRTWVTEITVVQAGEDTLFGARLFNVTRGADDFFSPSLPGVIRQLIESVPCMADGQMLSAAAEIVSRPEHVGSLVELIEKDGRKLPVVVVAEGRARPEFADADTVARKLAGAAHVFYIHDEMTWELRRHLGRQLSVFDGAARIYAGGLLRDEADPFDHPRSSHRPQCRTARRARAGCP